jgi:hypothetical protein
MSVAFVQDHWVQDRAVDMTGQTINGCRVIERVASINRSARWRVEAACGHVVLLTRDEMLRRQREGLKPYVCNDCRRARAHEIPDKKVCSDCGVEKIADEFYRRSDRKNQLQSRCKGCWNLPRETDRVAEPIECGACCDQPWRRPHGGCKCGGAYAPEDMRIERYHAITGNGARWSFPDWEV